MASDPCPAAFVITGVDRGSAAVLCRANSTERGQQNRKRGPIDVVRPGASCATFHGYCLNGCVQVAAREIRHELGAVATPAERDFADAALRTGAELTYAKCPTWRAEKANRLAAKLADQPGQRRTHGLTE